MADNIMLALIMFQYNSYYSPDVLAIKLNIMLNIMLKRCLDAYMWQLLCNP